MTREWLITADTKAEALTELTLQVRSFCRARRWKYRIKPELIKYEGRSKKLQGKWRAYARIEYQ